MSVLVFLEHHGDELQNGSLGVLAKAASLAGSDVAAVLIGGGDLAQLAAEAGRFGAKKVFVAQDASLEPPLPQPRIDVLEKIVNEANYDTVLFANSVLASDVAAGLAARLKAGLNWDLIDIELRGDDLVGKRLALRDSVLAEVGWRSARRLGLFRTGSFDATPSGETVPEIIAITPVFKSHSQTAHIVDQQLEKAEGPSITEAEVIVAGGRGLGAPENFALAEDLAKVLGGAVGATRAVVYAGWYPYAAQVGQTGKTVTPKLYIALGISGATQHKVGMQNSKVIVSINKDPNAPIFEFSDFGVVGDVHTIVPKLTELVRQHKES